MADVQDKPKGDTGSFWGIAMSVGKKYSQVVSKDFHISTAALDITEVSENWKNTPPHFVKVMIECADGLILLCSLSYPFNMHVPLDLNISAGTTITFVTNGWGCTKEAEALTAKWQVHLSGYTLPDDDTEMVSMCSNNDQDEYSHLVTSQITNNFLKRLSSLNGSEVEIENASLGEPKVESKRKKVKINDVLHCDKLQTTTIEDIKLGKGAAATKGDTVKIFYKAVNPKDGQIIAKHTTGKPIQVVLY